MSDDARDRVKECRDLARECQAAADTLPDGGADRKRLLRRVREWGAGQKRAG